MTLPVRLLAVTVATAVLTVGTPAVATAEPVTRDAFQTVLSEALQQVAVPEGMARKELMEARQPGIYVLTSSVRNPDGSYTSRTVMDTEILSEKSHVRCVDNTCFSKTSPHRKWFKNNVTLVDLSGDKFMSVNLDSMNIDSAATFDITGNLYTIQDPNQGTITYRVDANSVTKTIDGFDSKGNPLTYLQFQGAVTPVQVTKPPKRLIAQTSTLGSRR